MDKGADNINMEQNYDDSWEKVRLRNVRIGIAKNLIKTDGRSKNTFTRDELIDRFNLKQWDIKYLSKYLFDISDDTYTVNKDFGEFLEKVFASYDLAQVKYNDARVEYISLYSGIYNEEKHMDYTGFSNGTYNRIKPELDKLIPIVHWGTLPIFGKYLLYNREMDPETNTLAFYDHPDCLNALMDDLRGDGLTLSNAGDDTLDKAMPFKVFTRRWGHNDTYRITRTVDGWNCSHIAINGSCDTEGKPYLYSNLDQDGVFYPEEGIKYAMSRLWEDADDGIIDFQELSDRLQQIADWISNVEKAVGTQPEWVGYY